MKNKSSGGVLPAVVAAGLALLAVVVGTVATEVLDKESTQYGSPRGESFVWAWILQAFAPLGQTGLINDDFSGIGTWLPGYVLGLVVLVVVVFLVSWLGARAAGSALGVLLTTWFATALGAGMGGLASVAAYLVHHKVSDDRFNLYNPQLFLRNGLDGGYYWGMFLGLFIGLVAMLVWHTRRPRDPIRPGHPNQASGSTAWPPAEQSHQPRPDDSQNDAPR